MEIQSYEPTTPVTIYAYQCLITKKWYVGQTKRTLAERAGGGSGYKKSPFGKAIEEYGWNNFIPVILEENVPPAMADKRERFFIDFYNSFEDGYNSTSGGQCGFRVLTYIEDGVEKSFSKETRTKLSKALTGIKRSKETREKVSKVQKREVLCIETGEKFESAEEAGIKYNISNWHNINNVCNGKQLTAGGCHWEYTDGIKKSRNRKNCKPAGMKKIICIELNKEFDSVMDAARFLNLSNGAHISEAAKGKIDTCAGYHWKYSDSSETENKYYKKRDEESKRRIALSVSKNPVICIETKQVFIGGKAAARYFGNANKNSMITNVCKHNPQRTVFGYHWKYLEDYKKENPGFEVSDNEIIKS